MKFRAPLELNGKTATGVTVPEKVVASFGPGKRPAVRVTINGYSYRSTVAMMGGRFMLPVSAEHRAGAGIEAGDTIQVDLELDTQTRDVEVPADLAAALKGHAGARKHFDGLSFTKRKEAVRSIDDAKTVETRARRVEKAVAATLEGLASDR